MPIDELAVENRVLVFQVENQGVVLWGIRKSALGQDDPPVVVAWNDGPLVFKKASESVSSFALAATLIEIALNKAHGFSGVCEPEIVEDLCSWCVPLALEFRNWPARRMRFLVGKDTLVVAADDDKETSLQVAVRAGPAQEQARAVADSDDWIWWG